MAQAQEEVDLNLEVVSEDGDKQSKKKLYIIIATVIAFIIIGIVVFFLIRDTGESTDDEIVEEDIELIDEAVSVKKQPAQYIKLPRFIVNLAPEPTKKKKKRQRRQFLKVEVQVMARSTRVIETITAQQPLIQNNLSLIFSSKTDGQLASIESQQALRQEALRAVTKVIKAEIYFEEDDTVPDPLVEKILFTSFIVQ